LVDASVLLASEDPDDAHHADATRLLEGAEPLATLDLAYYEVAGVALGAWRDASAAHRLRERVAALAEDGGVFRSEVSLLASAAAIAEEHGISPNGAAYVAAARASGSTLVSCDGPELVALGLACLPGTALQQCNRS
jgi:predicted nucleic acid-binding protein